MQSEMNNCVLLYKPVAIAQGHSNLIRTHVNGLKLLVVPFQVGFSDQLKAANQHQHVTI